MLMEKRPNRPDRPFTWFVKQCINFSVTAIFGCSPGNSTCTTGGYQFAIRTAQVQCRETD